jgi:hypothetical protein
MHDSISRDGPPKLGLSHVDKKCPCNCGEVEFVEL